MIHLKNGDKLSYCYTVNLSGDFHMKKIAGVRNPFRTVS